MPAVSDNLTHAMTIVVSILGQLLYAAVVLRGFKIVLWWASIPSAVLKERHVRTRPRSN